MEILGITMLVCLVMYQLDKWLDKWSVNKNMLDKSLIGEEEPRQPLKCEECGLYFESDTQPQDWRLIDETGKCYLCN